MKTYPKIHGPREVLGRPCIAFRKYDGSNLRMEWSHKRGWFKYGSRTRLFDQTDDHFGDAVELFQNTYGDTLIPEIQKLNLPMKDGLIVFCEYLGPNSFGGQHKDSDPKQLVLIDVNLTKKGFLTPEEFISLNVPKAEILYQGVFDQDFVEAIQAGEYVGEDEGVVAKGIWKHPKNPKDERHSLWMAKVKTRWWIEQLRQNSLNSDFLKTILRDNEVEQEV